MKKHFKLTNNIITNDFGIELRQIEATRDSKYALLGDLGGYVEKLDNLCDEAWVSDNAQVWRNAKVSGSVWAYGNVRVYANAQVGGNAMIYDNANIRGNAKISGDAQISGHVMVCGNAKISGDAWVGEHAKIYNNAQVFGDAKISGNAKIGGETKISDNIIISDNALIKSNNDICHFAYFGSENFNLTAFKCIDSLVRINSDYFNGTLEEFQEEIKYNIDEHEVYLAMIQMIKIKFKL